MDKQGQTGTDVDKEGQMGTDVDPQGYMGTRGEQMGTEQVRVVQQEIIRMCGRLKEKTYSVHLSKTDKADQKVKHSKTLNTIRPH